jgi:hypothetical protein
MIFHISRMILRVDNTLFEIKKINKIRNLKQIYNEIEIQFFYLIYLNDILHFLNDFQSR